MTMTATADPIRLNYLQYVIDSDCQAYANALRILLPDELQATENPRLLYVLPVNPDVSARWGDGLDTVMQLDLHNRYGMIAVAPSFSDWPWYADHSDDLKIRQETYFVEEVVPFVDGLYPQASQTRLLLGFSKSGNGAYQLLLRHPELFHAAAIWDAPVMMGKADKSSMPDIYGTEENFEHYYIPRLLEEHAAQLRPSARLGLFGYGFFSGENEYPEVGEHVASAHQLMKRLGIPHIYDNSTWREHHWDSGWVADAVAALDEMSSP